MGAGRLRGGQRYIQKVPCATPSSLEFLLQVVGTTVYKGKSLPVHSTPQPQAFYPHEEGGEGGGEIDPEKQPRLPAFGQTHFLTVLGTGPISQPASQVALAT